MSLFICRLIICPDQTFLSLTTFVENISNICVGFINLGSPMDPLSCNTWPSRQRSNNACLARPRYTMTSRDHDPVPDRHLWPGDLVGAPTGRPGRGGTVVRLRPHFSDRGYDGPLLAALSRPTMDTSSVWAWGADGANKVRCSSQPQY